MAGEVREAVRAFQERKLAADAVGALTDGEATERFARLVLVGMDLEAEEVLALAAVFRGAYQVAACMGVSREAACEGAWIDGLLTGVTLVERRGGEVAR